MLTAALWTFVATLLAVLMVPWAVAVELETRPSAGVRLDVRGAALAGLLGLALRLESGSWGVHPMVLMHPLRWLRLGLGSRRTRARTGAAPEGKGESERSAPFRDRALTLSSLTGPAVRLMGGLRRVVRLSRLRVRGRFGLADPAHTGMAYGWLLAVPTGGRRRLDVCLAPSFDRAGFEGSLALGCRLYLGRLLWLALRVAASVLWHRWRDRVGRRRAAPAPGGSPAEA